MINGKEMEGLEEWKRYSEVLPHTTSPKCIRKGCIVEEYKSGMVDGGVSEGS